MKKLLLLLAFTAIVSAEDCREIKYDADRWKELAKKVDYKVTLNRRYFMANYKLSEAIYCQNKKILEKLEKIEKGKLK